MLNNRQEKVSASVCMFTMREGPWQASVEEQHIDGLSHVGEIGTQMSEPVDRYYRDHAFLDVLSNRHICQLPVSERSQGTA